MPMIVSVPPMPDQPKNSPVEPAGGRGRRIVCGDCREPVDSMTGVADIRRPDSGDYTDWYCPGCARPVPAGFECPACRSVICAECGAVMELVDELGIG